MSTGLDKRKGLLLGKEKVCFGSGKGLGAEAHPGPLQMGCDLKQCFLRALHRPGQITTLEGPRFRRPEDHDWSTDIEGQVSESL